MKQWIKSNIPFVQWLLLKRRERRIRTSDYQFSVNDPLKPFHERATQSQESGLYSGPKRDIPLLISLTSYGYRIQQLYLVIDSLMHQTVKADAIILWLSETEKHTPLPETLSPLIERGLTVRYCEDDKSYKKLIPSLQHYPNHAIITVDDDWIYPEDHIEKLYAEHLNHPHTIIAHRAHKMQKSDKGALLPYRQWGWETTDTTPSHSIFPTSGAGTLFPPNCLYKDTTKRVLWQKYCPHGDDIWWKAMAIKHGTLCKQIDNPNRLHHEILSLDDDVTGGLWSINRTENDKQLKKLQTLYPGLFDLI